MAAASISALFSQQQQQQQQQQHRHGLSLLIPPPCQRSISRCRGRPPLVAALCPRRPSPSLSAAYTNHGSLSRREAAAAIGLFFQSLQFALAFGSDAYALGDTEQPGLEIGRDFLPVQAAEIRGMEHPNPAVASSPKLVSYLRGFLLKDSRTLGIMPTYKQGTQSMAPKGLRKNSGSSLGLIGSLILGFLFWQKRQARIANESALEDIRVKITKAEAELCSKTRSSVRLKLESGRVSNQVCKDDLENEVLLHQLISAKSKVIELEQQLQATMSTLQSLICQESSLLVAFKKVEQDHSVLMESLNQELKTGHMLEAELKATSLQAKLRDEGINSLKLALAEQENILNEHLHALDTVKKSLDRAKEKLQSVETEMSMSNRCLCEKEDTVQTLTEELTIAIAKNEASSEKLRGLNKHVKDLRQMCRAEMARLENSLNSKTNEGNSLSSKLAAESENLEGTVEALGRLFSERDSLKKTLSDQQDVMKQVTEQLKATSQKLNAYEIEKASLNTGLISSNEFKEQLVRTCVELQSEADKKLSSISHRLGEEQDLSTTLAKELHEASEALRASEKEASSLHDSMKSCLSCHEQLKEDLSTLRETGQSASLAIKKQKRASAYAKKKLVLCEQVLAEESGVLCRLNEDLEQTRRHLQDSNAQLSTWSSELEKANASAACLEAEVSLLKQNLDKERTMMMELQAKTGGITTAKTRLVKRNAMSKREKIGRKSGQIHEPRGDATKAAVGDGLGAPAA